MVTTKQHLVNASTRRARTYSGTSTKSSITVHETANTSRGADASAHARLQAGGNSRAASWHEQIDDHEAIQSFPHTARCWHAGWLARNSIAFELCVNADGDFRAMVANAAERIAEVAEDESIPQRKIRQHHHWTRKNCPTFLRAGNRGVTWKAFKAKVQSARSTGSAGGSGGGKRKRLKVDGLIGTSSITEIQEDLDAPYVDGEISRQNRYWKKRNPGLTTGWKWLGRRRALRGKGSPTIRRFQRMLNALGFDPGAEDGLIGPRFIKAVQRWLTSLGLYDGKIDGEVWREGGTAKGLQKAINRGSLKKAAKEAGLR